MKDIKKIFILLAAFFLVLGFSAEVKASSGTIGSGVVHNENGQITWEIDKKGKLTVTGVGNVPYYSEYYKGDFISLAPWGKYRLEIKSAEIHVTEMFADCCSLTELDLRGFDTSNVKTMTSMFDGCTSLEELNFTGWDTSNLFFFGDMFTGCSSLEQIDLSDLNVSSVKTTIRMFKDCTSLTAMDLSRWDTRKLESVLQMFEGCTSLKKANLSGIKLQRVLQL